MTLNHGQGRSSASVIRRQDRKERAGFFMERCRLKMKVVCPEANIPAGNMNAFQQTLL